jgi:DNA-binding transcriptional LysR family regulator
MPRMKKIAPYLITLEYGSPETLLAFARGSFGAAVVPSTAHIDRQSLRLAAITFRGHPLTTEIAVLWSGTRRLPRYAEAFSTMLAAHMRAMVSPFEEKNAASAQHQSTKTDLTTAQKAIRR